MKEIWSREDKWIVNSEITDSNIDNLLYIVFTYREGLTEDVYFLSDSEMFSKCLLEV